MAGIEIVEVSPRDGIQSEARLLSTDEKVALVGRAVSAGIRRVEVTSFVNPSRVPQMADSAVLPGLLSRDGGLSAIGLVLNEKGAERALAAGVDEINGVVVASDTFSRRNQGTTTAEGIEVFGRIAAAARGRIPVTLTVGAAFGCPFEGEVTLDRLLQVVEGAMAFAPDELALADTIGVAGPGEVHRRFAAVRERFPGIRLRGHFHNTRNTGYANAWAAVGAGVTTLDASFGGVGGCPFAPRATGNIATEDLAYMLSRSGIRTGVDLAAAVAAAEWLEGLLEKTVPGQLMRAGLFPPAA